MAPPCTGCHRGTRIAARSAKAQGSSLPRPYHDPDTLCCIFFRFTLMK